MLMIITRKEFFFGGLAMTTMEPTKTKRRKLHPFLPEKLQRGTFLLWLKRTHAWTGLFGALMFVVLGFSGILLNHRNVMKIEVGTPQVSSVEFVREGMPFESRDDFAAWVQATYGVIQEPSASRKAPRIEAVSFEGTEQKPVERWDMRFRGPNAAIEASYVPAANLVALERTGYSFLALLKELHMGHGIGVVWILLIDAIAGALLLMSLSGILLWSRLHGPRLAAAGLLLACAVWVLLGAAPYMIGGIG
ncbi:PepSY-associated TM helix domain-containing protein [Parvularcula lutaonensis]|uniref:PepSY-associated TM helix domain-containing protein n=1 Tax=Parvularcula lutaonensis TaxID=491923 RepID=A0ABV7MCW9_9PROT|nr:PepSY-associated TM helix domain-containing protein [Parvularcula lutaonensis]GGY51128.1 hypothetical protein GCM10007148_19990 [Parvularcula lutaonensis]